MKSMGKRLHRWDEEEKIDLYKQLQNILAEDAASVYVAGPVQSGGSEQSADRICVLSHSGTGSFTDPI